MKKGNRILMSAFCVLCTTYMMADLPEKIMLNVDSGIEELIQQYEIAIDGLVAEKDAESQITDTEMNPRLIRLFGDPVLYESSVSNALKGEGMVDLYGQNESADYLEYPSVSNLAYLQEIEDAIDNTMLVASVMHPEKFSYTEKDFKESIMTVESVQEQKLVGSIVPQMVPQEFIQDQAVGVDMKVKKPNFWIVSGEASLQFTQNYISGNWSQGGESSNTLLSGFVYSANYNDQNKVQWDNKFEAKLGFTTTPSDETRNYRISTDLLRLSSKLLLKAIRSWNYSFDVQSKTQTMRSYQNNSTNYTSAFLAPLETSVGIGMDYKKKHNNFDVSINIAPLSYRYVYVREKFLAGRYGIKGDHRSLQEFGSKTTIKHTWKITDNITWKSMLEAFTSYEKMIANWENTFDFAVSKYLSTTLFMHGRFDDGVRRKEGYNYFQFKEYLQFGLKYTW